MKFLEWQSYMMEFKEWLYMYMHIILARKGAMQ